MIGFRSSIRRLMKSRGIRGKWKFIWHSSPSPKYLMASSGHWLASASSIRPGQWVSTCLRKSRRNWCVSGKFSQLVPSRSNRYGMASSRTPSTPRAIQKSHTSNTALITAGLSKFRSGWWWKNRCQ